MFSLVAWWGDWCGQTVVRGVDKSMGSMNTCDFQVKTILGWFGLNRRAKLSCSMPPYRFFESTKLTITITKKSTSVEVIVHMPCIYMLRLLS